MVNHKHIGYLLLFLILITRSGNVQGEINLIEPLLIGQEVHFLLVIDRIIAPKLFSSLYEAISQNGSPWPILVPTKLPSSDYSHELKFRLNGWSSSNISYGDAYRRGNLIYQNKSSLLMIQSSLSSTELEAIVTSIYQNFTWTHNVHVGYDDKYGYDLTLEFTSPADSENQAWSGWFSWNYDKKGIAERFDLLVWRTDSTLILEYNPLTDPDQSNLTAYYEFVFETPRNYNEGLAFITIFAGGIVSLMISPFVFFGFIVRRPTKKYTKIAHLPPEEHTTTFWKSQIGLFKLIIGLSIISLLVFFQFILPSNTSSGLVSIFITSFLWFGLYLPLRSGIEKISNASVNIVPIITISFFSIILGLTGLQELQRLIVLFVNPEMFESIAFVSLLFYSTTFGSFIGLILIYESFYIKKWSHNPISNVFIIQRQNPWVNMTEYILSEYIEEVTIDSQTINTNWGIRNSISLRLQTIPPYKAKEQTWILQDKNSYLNLFSTVDYLNKNDLITISDSSWLIQSLQSNPVPCKEEKLRKFEEQHPEFGKKLREELDLDDELRRKGVVLTYENNKTTTLKFASYRKVARKSFIINLSVLSIVTIGMTYTFFRLLDIAYRSLTAVGGVIFVGGLLGLITIFIWGIMINYVRQRTMLISKHPIELHLSPESFDVKIRNNIQKYPITLITNVITKRDFITGVALCLSKDFGKLPLIYLADKQLARLLASYLSRNARKVFQTSTQFFERIN